MQERRVLPVRDRDQQLRQRVPSQRELGAELLSDQLVSVERDFIWHILISGRVRIQRMCARLDLQLRLHRTVRCSTLRCFLRNWNDMQRNLHVPRVQPQPICVSVQECGLHSIKDSHQPVCSLLFTKRFLGAELLTHQLIDLERNHNQRVQLNKRVRLQRLHPRSDLLTNVLRRLV